MTERIRAGLGGCPDCGLRVLYALAATGDLIALDEGHDGPVVVRWDNTGTPRVRDARPEYQPKDGEHRWRLHRRSCIALAPVVDLGTARTLKRPGASGRRHARAR
jgi:hypothetical protein